jgi:hypothetical protein
MGRTTAMVVTAAGAGGDRAPVASAIGASGAAEADLIERLTGAATSTFGAASAAGAGAGAAAGASTTGVACAAESDLIDRVAAFGGEA